MNLSTNNKKEILNFQHLQVYWCKGRDLNPHAISGIRPSNVRVCRFHHLCTTVNILPYLKFFSSPNLKIFIVICQKYYKSIKSVL